MTPTARSLKHLRDLGYIAEVVEKWIPQARKRKDLFGFIDILAIRDGEILGAQVTTGAHVSERVKKINDSELLPQVLMAMRVVVHGWRKNAKGKWVPREVEIECPV